MNTSLHQASRRAYDAWGKAIDTYDRFISLHIVRCAASANIFSDDSSGGASSDYVRRAGFNMSRRRLAGYISRGQTARLFMPD